MNANDYLLKTVQQEIVDHNLFVKALIQDILSCKGPLAALHELNNIGRSKISLLRKHIEQFENLARDANDPELISEADSHRQQLTSTLQAFRKANISTLAEIEISDKNELLSNASEENVVRQRQRNDKAGVVKMSSNVTDQLLSISRHLADTTKRSADTLETLAMSSANVQGTRDELQNTAGTITQSGKLLKKYGRREFTDKILIFFAFAFFSACVFYIVQKRLF